MVLKRPALRVGTIILAIMILAPGACIRVYAESTPLVYLSPSTIVDSTKTPGTTFTVDTLIDDVNGLFAWQASLLYDQRF